MKKMKPLIRASLILVLLFTLFAGCGSKNETFSYSDGIDENGFYKEIRALDYVELSDYTNLSVPNEVYAVSDESVQVEIDAILSNFITDGKTPQLTDEFVADNLWLTYGYRTVSDMKAAIRNSIQGAAMYGYIREYLLENMTVKSVPEHLIAYQENTLLKAYQDSADFYDMELADFLKVYVRVSTVDILLEKTGETNTENAKFALIIQGIAEDAGITVTDDDVTAYFIKHLGTQDYAEYEETYGLPYIRYITLQQAVVDYIVEHATQT